MRDDALPIAPPRAASPSPWRGAWRWPSPRCCCCCTSAACRSAAWRSTGPRRWPRALPMLQTAPQADLAAYRPRQARGASAWAGCDARPSGGGARADRDGDGDARGLGRRLGSLAMRRGRRHRASGARAWRLAFAQALAPAATAPGRRPAHAAAARRPRAAPRARRCRWRRRSPTAPATRVRLADVLGRRRRRRCWCWAATAARSCAAW